MNRGALIRFAVLTLLASGALAQNTLEIIGLRHRMAGEVIPSLQPLLESGATLSGQGSQLFVRTSPGNLAELRRALEAIDRPARRLLISVRFDSSLEAASRGIEAGARVTNRDAQVELRAQDSRSRADERVDQRVQALEGARATILTGESRPLRQRQYIQTPAGVVSQEVTVVQETTSGFEVVPRISGDTVHVEVAGTTASGKLGEWFLLGAVDMGGSRDARGLASATQSSRGETRRAWIRVDEIQGR
jgi:hypothetical protein